MALTKMVDGVTVEMTADEEAAVRAEWAAEDTRRSEAVAAAAAVAYRHQRAVAYRDEMGAETGNFIVTIGDVLDTILGQIEQTPEADRTAAMNTLLATRADIKARIPKP